MIYIYIMYIYIIYIYIYMYICIYNTYGIVVFFANSRDRYTYACFVLGYILVWLFWIRVFRVQVLGWGLKVGFIWSLWGLLRASEAGPSEG